MCFKKLFCKHDYRILSTFTTDSDPSIGYRQETMCNIYCPKCKKDKAIAEFEYNKIIARQRIDEEYEAEREFKENKLRRWFEKSK